MEERKSEKAYHEREIVVPKKKKKGKQPIENKPYFY